MAEFEVGEAWVSLQPSARGFSKKAKAALADVDLEKTVDLEVEKSKLEAAIKDVKAQLAQLDREKVNPSIDFDIAVAEARIDELKGKLEELRKGKVDPKVDLQIEKAEKQADKLIAKLDELQRGKIDPQIDVKIERAQAQVNKLAAKLDELGAKKVTPAVEAQTARFTEQLNEAQAKLAELQARKATPEVDLLGIEQTKTELDRVVAKLAELNAKRANPTIDAVGIAKTEAELNQVEAQLAALNERKATVDVDADISAAQNTLRELEAKLDDVNRRQAEPKVTADTTQADARLRELESELQRVSMLRTTPQVELQVAQAQQQALAIRAELERLGAMRPSVQVTADIASASAKLAVLNAELNRIDGRNVKVDADASGMSRAGLIAGGLVAALGAVPPAAAAAGGALAGLAGIAGALGQGVGAAILGFSGISDALKAVESDEKSAATSSAASSKTRSSGANQVASAQASLQQAQTQADRAAITGAQSVSNAQQSLVQARTAQVRTAVQGAQQIQDAEQQLAQVQTAAARTAIQSNQQVADAERSLAQAVTQAARQRITSDQQVASARQAVSQAIQSANQRVRSAEESLASAQRTRQYAQESLTRATEDATKANRDLQLSVAGAGIAEQRAALSLAQARQRLAQTKTSDPLELQDLQLSVREAEQSLKEVQVRYGDLRGEQSKWAQTGIQGSDQVVAATRSLQDAQRGVQSAQQGVTQAQVDGAQSVQAAQTALAQTVQQAGWQQADSAQQIQQAQQGVARAAQQAGWQQADAAASVAAAQVGVQRATEQAAQANADAAQQVQQAQAGVQQAVQQAAWQQADAAKGVADAQRALAQAYQTTGAAGSSAGKQSAYALSKLSDAGREFVRFMTQEWKPAWENTSKEIADRMLPGIEGGMRSLIRLQPTLTAGLAQTGSIIGDLAARGGDMMASGPFRKDFAEIMSSNNRMLSGMGDAGLSLVGALTDLWTAAGPIAEEFVRMASSGAQAFESWIIGEKASGALGRNLQSMADTAMWLGGVLKDLVVDIWNTAQGFAPLAGVLIEVIRGAANFIGTIASWNPVLTSVVGGLGLAAYAVSGLNGALGKVKFLSTITATGGLAGSLKTLLVPSLLAGTTGMTTFGDRATTLAGKLGAGETAASRFGSAAKTIGSSLPLLAVGVGAIVAIIDTMTVSTGEATDALSQGGKAAADMRAELAQNDKEYSRDTINGYLSGLLGINTTSAEAAKKLDEQRASMTALQRAQSFATQAQGDYDFAVQQFGVNSPQAVSALRNLHDRTQDLDTAQRAARDGTDLATAAIRNQRDTIQGTLNADLQKRQAVHDMEQAQRDLAQAVQQYGASSPEAEEASLRLESAQSQVASAALKAKDGYNGQAQAIGNMVAQSNGQLSPTLVGLVQSLDNAGLAAAGATVKIDGAGNAVATFPNGKTVVLDANVSPAMLGLDGVALKLNSVPGNKTVTVATLAADAEAKLTSIGFTVTHLPNGQVQVTANDAMARGTLIAFQQFAAWQQANPQLSADPAKANEAMRNFLISAGQQTGVPMLDANPQRADDQVRGAVDRYNHTWSTMPVNSNPAEADKHVGETQRYASQWQVFGLSANPDYKGIGGFFTWLGDMIRGAQDSFSKTFGTGEGSFFQWTQTHIMGRATGGLVEGYASGGRVRGGLRGYASGAGGSQQIASSDTVPAMLTPGEFVVRKQAVDKVGLPALQAINGLALGGLVGFAAGGRARPQDTGAALPALGAAGAGAGIDVPSTDPSAISAAASATDALSSSMAVAAGQAQALDPQLSALATTQTGLLVPATAAVTAGQQAMVTAGILPLVGTLLSSLFPTLGLYQQQVGVNAPLANTALQAAQFGTQLSTTNTALNTQANTAAMNAAVTGMALTGQVQHGALQGAQLATQTSTNATQANTSVASSNMATSMTNMSLIGQAQHAGLRAGQAATRLDTDLTNQNMALHSQNMAIDMTSMSMIGQQQHAMLRYGQDQTQASTVALALNNANQNDAMISSTGFMSATNQNHLNNLRIGQAITGDATRAFADGFRAQMGRTVPDSADPIRWVINFPIHSITDAWNNLDGQFALGKHVNPYIPNFATGGSVAGAGGPTDDKIPAMLSDGEFVVRESVASRVPHFLNALNGGQAEAIQAAGGNRAKMPGFADGGVIHAQQVAASMNGKPYIWGGASPAGADCSGMAAIVTNALRGEPNPFHRIGTAASNPWPGFVRGLSSAWSVGFNSGHMAGTLGGVNVESASTPIRYPGAHGADSGQFTGTASLPQVGGVFASGGNGGGGGFDPTPMVDAAFAKAYREIADVPKFFGPSAQVARDQGVAKFGADKVREKALSQLQTMFAGAGLFGPLGEGAPFIVKQISDAARIYQKGVDGATIGVATGLVESNLRNLPGGDRDSVGVFQQRPSQGWGSIAECMNVLHAAGSFFSRFPANWHSMDPGAVAQSVQRSAFPGRYSTRMGQARGLVAQFGGAFDNGGLLGPGTTLAYNNTGTPERVLDNVETRNYDTLTRLMRGGGVKVDSPAASSSPSGVDRPIVASLYDADNTLITTMRGVAHESIDAVTASISDGRRVQ